MAARDSQDVRIHLKTVISNFQNVLAQIILQNILHITEYNIEIYSYNISDGNVLFYNSLNLYKKSCNNNLKKDSNV